MTNDGGVDLIGESRITEFLSPIVCQATNSIHTTGVGKMRDFIGALTDDDIIDRYNSVLIERGISRPRNIIIIKKMRFAIYYSTTKFSDGALKRANRLGIATIGMKDIIKSCEENSVGLIKNTEGEIRVDVDFFDDIRSRFQGAEKMEGFDINLTKQVFNPRTEW
jgi:hypothetical protein